MQGLEEELPAGVVPNKSPDQTGHSFSDEMGMDFDAGNGGYGTDAGDYAGYMHDADQLHGNAHLGYSEESSDSEISLDARYANNRLLTHLSKILVLCTKC